MRKDPIRREREPYVERLLPVWGFRTYPPDPLDRSSDTPCRARSSTPSATLSV